MINLDKCKLISAVSRAALLGFPLMTLMGGCATYEIQHTNSTNSNLKGVSYFLPKTQVDATVSWRITQCEDIRQPFLKPVISETIITTTDYSEHYMIDTSTLSGRWSNDALGLTMNDQGVLTAFNVTSTGVGSEIIAQVSELVAPLIGNIMPGSPVALEAGNDQPYSGLCDLSINGQKIKDLLVERSVIVSALTQLQISGKDSSVEDIAKNSVKTDAVEARRLQLLNRLAAADKSLSFSSRKKFDLRPTETETFKIDLGILHATNTVNDPSNVLPAVSLRSKITATVADSSGWTSVANSPSNFQYPRGRKNSSLIYRIPGVASVDYKLGSDDGVKLVSTQHVSPQAGRYAHLPLSSAVFGKTDTKITFNSLGVMTSYGLEETSGVSAAVTSVNSAIDKVQGHSTEKAKAQKAAYDAELARLQSKKALDDFIAENE